jgi:hypothetical protein
MLPWRADLRQPSGGDGVIHDATTSVAWRMEHVLVPRQNERQTSATDSIEDRVLTAMPNLRPESVCQVFQHK